MRTFLEIEHDEIEKALHSPDAAMAAGESPGRLASIMDTVVNFCVSHFEHEESAFRKVADTGADERARAHEQMLREFREARNAIAEGNVRQRARHALCF